MVAFGKKWSKVEIAVLDMWDDIEELKKKLPDRTVGAIKSKIAQLNKDPEPKKASSMPWTEEEIALFPREEKINKAILESLAQKLKPRDKSSIWRKLKSMEYVWEATAAEPTEDNPHPNHGKLWTAEELAQFPAEKLVNKEILYEVIAKIPLRKPTSIWPRMKKDGYIWDTPEEEETVKETVEIVQLSDDEKYVLSFAHELGFRSKAQRNSPSLNPGLKDVADYREKISVDFELPLDFTSGELYYAVGNRISPFPWDSFSHPEIAKAYRDRDRKSILEAAKVLHQALEDYING